MKHKLLILILLIIGIIGFSEVVGAVPPFATADFPDGYAIEFPDITYLKQDVNFKYHIHVFNASNGVYITNATANCTIHIYNATGSHIVEEDMNWDGNLFDFELEVLGGNFTNTGLYSFITFCTSGTQGGYIQSTFMVTANGTESPTGMPTFLGILVIIIFATACFMMFLSITMNEVAFKIFFLMVALIFLMATLITGYMVLTDSNVTAAISTTTLGLVVVMGMILFIMFIWILIRQTINALDLYNIKRGKSWDVGSGSSVGGYNTKRAY